MELLFFYAGDGKHLSLHDLLTIFVIKNNTVFSKRQVHPYTPF